MAVSITETISQYAGNASTVTPYPTVFPFQSNDWLEVWVTDENGAASKLVIGTDYTVTGAGDDAGGDVVTLAAIPSTSTVTIARVTPKTQLLDLAYNDRLPAELVEDALDKTVFMVQEIFNRRSLNFPVVEPAANDTELPAPADRKGCVVGFDETTGEAVLYELPLATFSATPPASGTYVLQSVDGVMEWVAASESGITGFTGTVRHNFFTNITDVETYTELQLVMDNGVITDVKTKAPGGALESVTSPVEFGTFATP